jgi:uncharacterized protein (TIGR03435 family)
MRNGFLFVILLALAHIEGPAQVVNPNVKFEVASVKPSQPPNANAMVCKGGPGSTDPGFFTCSNINVTNLVGRAFRLMPYQLPSTDTGERALYEISAKVPPGTTVDQFNLMLRNLLVERFKLIYHYEKKETQVYALSVAKGGLKMKESSPSVPEEANKSEGSDSAPPRLDKFTLDAEGFPKVAVPKRGSASMTMTNGRSRWTCSEAGMEYVVSMLAAQMGGPVTDETGLHGKYDFTVSWAIDNNVAPDSPGPTLVEAIQEQLGLKLERKKGFVDIFVIDHVERPSEN